MYRGRLVLSVPVLWTLGFMVTFTIGGMTGVLAIPGADYVLHNSLFLIAHFHNTIIGGAVFGYWLALLFGSRKPWALSLTKKPEKQPFGAGKLVSFWRSCPYMCLAFWV